MTTFEFSHIWSIENFSFCLNEAFLESPPFGAEDDPGTRWSLRQHPKGILYRECISLYLRLISSASSKVESRFEVSFLDAEGQARSTRNMGYLTTHTLECPSQGWETLIFLKSVLEKSNPYLTLDRLSVRCVVSYASKIENIPGQE